MNGLNTVEKKILEINDILTYKITFSKNINIRERNGNWYLDGWVYYNGKSERVHKSTLKKATKSEKRYIEKNKQTMLLDLSKIKRDLDIEKKGIENQNNIPMFGDFSNSAIELKKHKVQIETYNGYKEKCKRYIQPYFKDFRLDKITSFHIEEWQNWVVESFNITKSLKDIRSVLSIILKSAKKNKYISENPLLDTDMLKFEKSTTNLSYTDSEMNLILNECDNYIKESKSKPMEFIRNQLKNLIYLSYGSGMRSGEIIGLQWRDIDFKNKTINIDKTMRNGRVKSTKTESGIRVIDMSEESYNSLVSQRDLCMDLDSETVFLTQYKKPYTNVSEISKGSWKTYLNYCNIDYKRFYNLRHTFATKVLSNGVKIHQLSGHLGHKQISTTMNRYIDSNFYKGMLGGKSIINDTLN